MIARIFFAGLVAGAMALPITASAESACAERVDLVTKLKEQYGESERGMGLSGKEAVVEIWSSEKTGTWTIVMTHPNGMTCVIVAGDSWMEAPPEKGPET